MEKICEIVRENYTWVLIVDGEVIPFESDWGAAYFTKHYKGLGYKVIEKDTRNGHQKEWER